MKKITTLILSLACVFSAHAQTPLTSLDTVARIADTDLAFLLQQDSLHFKSYQFSQVLTYVDSSILKTGWERIDGDDYTEGSPLSILAGDTATVSINGNTATLRGYLPAGVDSLWHTDVDKFFPVAIGDAYQLRFDFKAKTSANSGGYAEVIVDIGDPVGEVLNRIITFPKGSGEQHKFSTTSAVYTLDTFVGNGAQIKIRSGLGTTSIYDVGLLIVKTHHDGG